MSRPPSRTKVPVERGMQVRTIGTILVGIALALPLLAGSRSAELDRVVEQYKSCKNLRIENRLPTILAFSGGQVVGQIVGARPKKDFKEIIERALGA